jgi:hypothetical protein
MGGEMKRFVSLRARSMGPSDAARWGNTVQGVVLRTRKISALRFALRQILLVAAGSASAEISVRPDALMHYSYCISHAKQRNGVFLLDRGTLYRCGDDVAVAYFNYLGRRRAPEKRAVESEGVFIYRLISGVGKCWNKIEDAEGNPVSIYGCDVYVEL